MPGSDQRALRVFNFFKQGKLIFSNIIFPRYSFRKIFRVFPDTLLDQLHWRCLTRFTIIHQGPFLPGGQLDLNAFKLNALTFSHPSIVLVHHCFDLRTYDEVPDQPQGNPENNPQKAVDNILLSGQGSEPEDLLQFAAKR